MPLLKATSDDQVINIPGPGNFQFSAVRIEDLGATEYTLATVICDISGSVQSFADTLLQMIKAIAHSCHKSARADNLLLRVLLFNNNIYEVHGFKNLADIDIDNDYQDLDPKAMTALFDASYDGIGATLEYAKRLTDQDFDCNGCVYIITDGCDNQSSMTPASIKVRVDEAIQKEELESLITILIGISDPASNWNKQVEKALKTFKDDAGLTEFVKAGDATEETLAKLANYVSQSISSQSQALGTGGPSQVLTF